jgi:L-lactate permease
VFPIGWIILNVIFLYRLTVEKGWFEVLQRSIAGITPDRRLQLLLIAFCLGAFFEGAAGFGTPVAVTGAMLMGLGFSPLAAAGLSLIANTAPVAYGALGTPILGLATATGYDPYVLAGDPRLRRVLRGAAISHFQFHQSLDRRYRRFHGVDRLPARLSASLAAGGALDVAHAACP